MDSFMQELLQTFYDESAEIFEELDQSLLDLEKAPSSNDTVNKIFRSVHTLKGSANMMGLEKTGRLAHALEDLLDMIRAGKKTCRTDLINLFFDSVDCLKSSIAAEMNSGSFPPDYNSLIMVLKEETKKEDKIEEISRIDQNPPPEPSRTEEKNKHENQVEDSEESSTLRVDWEQLISLMSYVEELYVGRSKLNLTISELSKQYVNHPYFQEIANLSRTTNKLISRIQEKVMDIRRIPIQMEMNRIYRAIRDLSVNYNRNFKLEPEVINIEIDRGLWDDLMDLILINISSIVKNSPSVNDQSGKPIQRTLLFKSIYSGKDVLVQIIDRDSKENPLSESEIESIKDKLKKVRGRFDIIKKDAQIIFNYRLPTNSSIVQVLLADINGEMYAFTMSAIAETVKFTKQDIRTIQGEPVFPYKGSPISIHTIAEISDKYSYREISDNETYLGIVLAEGDNRALFLVDRIIGEDRVLIKEINDHSIDSNYIQGLTILGDGSIILILDHHPFLRAA